MGTLPRRVYQALRAMAAADEVQGALDEEHAAAPPPGPEAADQRLSEYLASVATAMVLRPLVVD